MVHGGGEGGARGPWEGAVLEPGCGGARSVLPCFHPPLPYSSPPLCQGWLLSNHLLGLPAALPRSFLQLLPRSFLQLLRDLVLHLVLPLPHAPLELLPWGLEGLGELPGEGL